MLIQTLARTLESSARSTYGRLEYRSLLQVILIHGTVAMKKQTVACFYCTLISSNFTLPALTENRARSSLPCWVQNLSSIQNKRVENA